METARGLAVDPLDLRCATLELPYELGEMPEIFSLLSDYDPVAFLESREGTEKYARYGIVAARPLMEIEGRGTLFVQRSLNGHVTERDENGL